MFTPEQAADFVRRNAPMSADDAREEVVEMGEARGQKISYEIGKLQIIQMLAAAGGIRVLPETDKGVRSATGTVSGATRGWSQGATLPEETRKGRRKKKKGHPQFNLREELFRMTGTDLTPDRWHRCRDGDDDDQRSRMGYEQVEDREAFGFLAEAVSGQ